MKKYITRQDYQVNRLYTDEGAGFGKPTNGTLSVVKLNDDHKCNGCLNEGFDTMMGFSWFNKVSELGSLYSLVHITPIHSLSSFLECRLCMNCIHDCVLSFKAKESWFERNGDPVKDLQKTIKKLEQRIEDLEYSNIIPSLKNEK